MDEPRKKMPLALAFEIAMHDAINIYVRKVLYARGHLSREGYEAHGSQACIQAQQEIERELAAEWAAFDGYEREPPTYGAMPNHQLHLTAGACSVFEMVWLTAAPTGRWALLFSGVEAVRAGAAAMTGHPSDVFVEVLCGATDLPGELRSRAFEIRSCEESSVDESYIAFLDQQIQLSPRGPEWTERLTRRRTGLAPFCGVQLVRGHVRAGTSGFTVYIDPRTRGVVYWEEYRDEYGSAEPDPVPDRNGR